MGSCRNSRTNLAGLILYDGPGGYSVIVVVKIVSHYNFLMGKLEGLCGLRSFGSTIITNQ
jgi:hypothetical protein